MKLFSPLYRRAMVWARHRHAPWYLAGMSFAAGALSMALLPFVLASLVGRGARFLLVADLMAWVARRWRRPCIATWIAWAGQR